jgi:predicted DNA-binding protein with PD1-like motif
MDAKLTNAARICVARLDKGERLLNSLITLVNEYQIKSGVVGVIGALQPAEIMYYQLGNKEYKSIMINESVELISATGTVTMLGSDPFVHLHIVVGRQDGTTMGGHCGPASTINITGEVTIIETRDPIYRAMNAEFKANFLAPEK